MHTSRCEACVSATQETAGSGLNRLYNILCWLWNIYEGAELSSVYFITNTKHCITYLTLNQLNNLYLPIS